MALLRAQAEVRTLLLQTWFLCWSVSFHLCRSETTRTRPKGKSRNSTKPPIQVFKLTCLALRCLSSAAGEVLLVWNPGARAGTARQGKGIQPSALSLQAGSGRWHVRQGSLWHDRRYKEKLNCINLSNLRFRKPHPPCHFSCRQIGECRLLRQQCNLKILLFFPAYIKVHFPYGSSLHFFSSCSFAANMA